MPDLFTRLTDINQLNDWLHQAWTAVAQYALVTETWVQVAVVAVAFLLARLAAPWIERKLQRLASSQVADFHLDRIVAAMVPLVLPLLWLLLQWLSLNAAIEAEWPHRIIRLWASLLAAWVVIRLTSGLVRDPLWSRIIAIAAWTVAALNILGFLDEAIALLDSAAVRIGGLRISALTALKACASLAILLWLANWIGSAVERRVEKTPKFTASLRLLLVKLLKIGLITLAVLIALSSVGIDITAFAVFTGAIGVGVGFGLQAVISNLVAGMIILLDRSLKVGDFVELQSGIAGEVREINVRSTVITTNDNIDILVPNSEFVSGSVTNWTYRDVYRRTRVPFGVAYGTDKEKVRAAGLEAAAEVAFTLTGHSGRDPQVWLVGFGDSSLNFELVVWLTPDAVKRPSAVNAAYCWALETALGKHGIEIPFPQRDIHVKGVVPVVGTAAPMSLGQPGERSA